VGESWKSRVLRWKWNFFPALRGTGARIEFASEDFREIRVRLPLNWRTRNYVGTIYGGSMYGAVDPFYMVMLIRNLGPDYVVWDKAATIRFRKPGRGTLYARFTLDDAELDAIRTELNGKRSIDRIYTVDLTDTQGTVHASVEKVIYIARKKKEEG
jgi:acyl-coenzyme A thioesterase PaaI-like protein